MRILADSSLPNISKLFGNSFQLTLYDSPQDLPKLVRNHEILLCRSTLPVTAALLAHSKIQYVATASSGIDHIDTHYLNTHGITLIDAKGCNAPAVTDYVVATLAILSQRDQLIGNKVGVIGAGEVGSRIIKRIQPAGFEVICFDPIKSLQDDAQPYRSLSELTNCDILCIHANLHHTPPHPSANLIETEFLSHVKPGVTIINAARGGIINEDALLSEAKPITYCTDVYLGEPAINPKIIDFSTLCTPHIAGHSIEAKNSAVVKICHQIHALIGVPIPPLLIPALSKGPTVVPCRSWQECVLSIYNPLFETTILKKATNKREAFIQQRQKHTFRHDFSYYDSCNLDSLTQSLLGNM